MSTLWTILIIWFVIGAVCTLFIWAALVIAGRHSRDDD